MTDHAAAGLSEDEITDAWVDGHADALFSYALTRLRRRQDAEDAVQEALLAAIESRQAFRGESAERTWLIGILRHKIVDHIRRSSRTSEVEPARDDMDGWCGKSDRWLHPPKHWQGDPQVLSENADFWIQVRMCFSQLTERQAQAFSLRTFDQVPSEEVCKLLGISATNLWIILHRARGRLRQCLESTWFAQEQNP